MNSTRFLATICLMITSCTGGLTLQTTASTPPTSIAPLPPNPTCEVTSDLRPGIFAFAADNTIVFRDTITSALVPNAYYSFRYPDCTQYSQAAVQELLRGAYCGQGGLTAYLSLPATLPYRVEMSPEQVSEAFSGMFLEMWQKEPVPVECAGTQAAVLIEETARREAMCSEGSAFFEQPIGTIESQEPPFSLEEVRHCREVQLWRAISILANSEMPPSDRFTQVLVDELTDTWVTLFDRADVQQLASDACSSADAGYHVHTAVWRYCEDGEKREIGETYLEARELDTWWDEDVFRGFEVLLGGFRFLIPLDDVLYFAVLLAEDDSANEILSRYTYVNQYNSRRSSRRALCGPIEEYYRTMLEEGEVYEASFGSSNRILRAGDANCADQFDVEGGSVVTGRFSAPARDIHTGRRIDMYLDFMCGFVAMELPSGTYHSLIECEDSRN